MSNLTQKEKELLRRFENKNIKQNVNDKFIEQTDKDYKDGDRN